MTNHDALTVSRSPIHAVIDDHGALPVLWAALGALLRRKPKKSKPVTYDLACLDNCLRDDIGLPPQELRSYFPHRSP